VGGAAAGNPSLVAVQHNYKTPYNQFWNLAVEAMVTRDTAIRVAYLGNLGTHLFMPTPLNDITPQPIGPTGNFPTVQAALPYSIAAQSAMGKYRLLRGWREHERTPASGRGSEEVQNHHH
jgi:hypothetical protein